MQDIIVAIHVVMHKLVLPLAYLAYVIDNDARRDSVALVAQQQSAHVLVSAELLDGDDVARWHSAA